MSTPPGTGPGPARAPTRAAQTSRPARSAAARRGAVAVGRHGEAGEALGDGRRDPAADADALGGVGAVERVAGDVVELGEPAALGERQQQVDAAQRLAERALDRVAEVVEPLAGQRGD